jgi:hypothetical protein
MYFSTKNYLKSNRYHTTKHTLKLQPLSYVSLAWSFCFVVSVYDGPIGLLILPFLGFIYFAYQKNKGEPEDNVYDWSSILPRKNYLLDQLISCIINKIIIV